MNKRKGLILFCLGLCACTVVPAPTDAGGGLPDLPPTMIASVTPPPTEPTVEVPTSVPVTVNSIFLNILAPLDDSIVNVDEVDVIGSASVGSVVSINDNILIVGEDQLFKVTVHLDEGQNLIEIVASDAIGNETSMFLTISFEK